MKFQRNTQQRRVVLEELQKLRTHPTAAVLYDIVRRRLPKISLGTVYRNLDLLARMGVIQKLAVNGAEARFDGNPAPHYHVRCVRCERVIDLKDVPDDLVKGGIGELGGYEILGYRLDFFGICPACRKQPVAENGQSPGN